jgi:hypothetical protein
VLRRRWDTAHAPIAADALVAWFAVAARLDDQPPPPDLAATWIELMPTSPVDVRSPAEVDRVDEWLRVAAALAEHAPALLESFGFPQHERLLARFADDAVTLVGEGADAPTTLASCLRRIAELLPSERRNAQATASLLDLRDEPRPPRDPPSEVAAPARSFVERILDDL